MITTSYEIESLLLWNRDICAEFCQHPSEDFHAVGPFSVRLFNLSPLEAICCVVVYIHLIELIIIRHSGTMYGSSWRAGLLLAELIETDQWLEHGVQEPNSNKLVHLPKQSLRFLAKMLTNRFYWSFRHKKLLIRADTDRKYYFLTSINN